MNVEVVLGAKARLGMRCGWMGVLVLVLAAGVDAQITKTATFENYAAGQQLGTSFTDPLSGITFSDSTASIEKFGIGSGLPEFDYGNYLSDGPGAGWAAYFGFTADIPIAVLADTVSLSVTYLAGNSDSIVLESFTGPHASGSLVAEHAISNATDPFVLSVTSSQYNIASFELAVSGVATGYDNISYTYLPEPSVAAGLLGLTAMSIRRRK